MSEQNHGVPAGAAPERAPSVLVVCAANQCRSPFVAELLRRRLGALEPAVEIRSAGLRADGGDPGESLAQVFAQRGVDVRDHRSTPLTGDALDADLVIVMEHHQVAEVVLERPDVWPRTFTLRELVRRGGTVAPRSRDERLADWVARVHAGRRRLELVGAWDDDVADPAGRPREVLENTLDELEDLVEQLGADLSGE